MLFHKNRNTQIQVYTKLLKLVKHVVSFIGKERVEDRRPCHKVRCVNSRHQFIYT